jgi:hypothetical protein
MAIKEEIRSQFIGALSGAKFPIHTPEELLNAMPAGNKLWSWRSRKTDLGRL